MPLASSRAAIIVSKDTLGTPFLIVSDISGTIPFPGIFVGVRTEPDGALYKVQALGGWIAFANDGWNDAHTVNGVPINKPETWDVKMVKNFGDNINPGSHALNTWFGCDTIPQWYYLTPASGSVSGNFTMTIRRASTLVELVNDTFTITATNA